MSKKPVSVKKEVKKAPAVTLKCMEASYEVLGAETSSATSDGQVDEEESINGEDVRADVEKFLKSQIFHGIISGAGFLMAVIGIWGDGA